MVGYVNREHVGRGLFSDVYKAVEEGSGEVVALKITVPSEECPPHDSRGELALLKQLDHANVIAVLGDFTQAAYGETELVMVLPYYQFSLDQVLKHFRKAAYPSGWRNKLPVDRAVGIIKDIAAALAYVHSKGIIHRDIKPENVLFSSIDGPAVLIDFGIAWHPGREAKEPWESKITDVGTTVYKPPEALFGIKNYNCSVDVWSFGCIIYKVFSSNQGVLFEPYINDIGLISAQFQTLGTPTVEIWPDVAHVESFTSLDFGHSEGKRAKELIPLAPPVVQEIFGRCLQFQSTDRLAAAEIVDRLAIANNR
ncbi:cyclin-dependent kinase 1 [Trichomonascus vanleenenianus]|uniref:serine/threonine-protein kinase n=1 Tax=Trichomonascus vanleenenianus TaxID=2268995 RepID=UPI003ECAF6FF